MLRFPRRAAAFLVAFACFTLVPPTAYAVENIATMLPQSGTGLTGRKVYGPWKAVESHGFDNTMNSPVDWAQYANGLDNLPCTGHARWNGQESTFGSNLISWKIDFKGFECFQQRYQSVPSSGWDSYLQLEGLSSSNGTKCLTDSATGVETVGLSGSLAWKKFGFSASKGISQACEPNKWSIEWIDRNKWMKDWHQHSSGDMNLGARPTLPIYDPDAAPKTSTCSKGTPTRVTSRTIIDKENDGRYDGLAHVQWTIEFAPGQLGKGDWTAAMAWNRGPTSNMSVGSPGSWTSVTGSPTVGAGAAGTNQIFVNFGGQTTNAGTSSGTTLIPAPVGHALQLVSKSHSPNNSYSATPGNPSLGVQGGIAYIQTGGGVNVPERCAFYFGPKIFDVPGVDWDDPFGVANGVPVDEYEYEEPVDAPPPAVPAVDSDPCDFKFSDPSSWTSAGACAMVGLLAGLLDLLRMLLDAVLKLPFAIIEAVGEVFVPDEGVLGASFEGISNDWSASSVGTFFTDAGSVATSFQPTTGPCAGPKIEIDWQAVQVESSPMSACGGIGSKVALLTRTMVIISVSIGTIYAIIRMIGASFGLNLNTIGAGKD